MWSGRVSKEVNEDLAFFERAAWDGVCQQRVKKRGLTISVCVDGTDALSPGYAGSTWQRMVHHTAGFTHTPIREYTLYSLTLACT